MSSAYQPADSVAVLQRLLSAELPVCLAYFHTIKFVDIVRVKIPF